MNRETFYKIADEALTETLIEMGHSNREDHRKICGWLAWPEYEPQDRETTEWCIELGDGRPSPSILRICIPKDMDEQEAKQKIKRRIHEWGIVPSSHLGYKAHT
jgi:hypothetical protein